ncbi:predicted protein [Lichtheimia corymbifera JMRC:FSU:9682]|uniref:Uncharacterized protein n=1 Tax=Lichtheimia corymbifera JMRC:FSU:9682 TaxID=1263082 RepID=A0A068SHY7_9FUNG|nr:predicted protein [Lichtheimia corymbifera JMRC:FSU:9682]
MEMKSVFGELIHSSRGIHPYRISCCWLSSSFKKRNLLVIVHYHADNLASNVLHCNLNKVSDWVIVVLVKELDVYSGGVKSGRGKKSVGVIHATHDRFVETLFLQTSYTTESKLYDARSSRRQRNHVEKQLIGAFDIPLLVVNGQIAGYDEWMTIYKIRENRFFQLVLDHKRTTARGDQTPCREGRRLLTPTLSYALSFYLDSYHQRHLDTFWSLLPNDTWLCSLMAPLWQKATPVFDTTASWFWLHRYCGDLDRLRIFERSLIENPAIWPLTIGVDAWVGPVKFQASMQISRRITTLNPAKRYTLRHPLPDTRRFEEYIMNHYTAHPFSGFWLEVIDTLGTTKNSSEILRLNIQALRREVTVDRKQTRSKDDNKGVEFRLINFGPQ